MTVSATDLKQNLGKYIKLSQTEDIFISKMGKVVCKLSNYEKSDKEIIEALKRAINNNDESLGKELNSPVFLKDILKLFN